MNARVQINRFLRPKTWQNKYCNKSAPKDNPADNPEMGLTPSDDQSRRQLIKKLLTNHVEGNRQLELAKRIESRTICL